MELVYELPQSFLCLFRDCHAHVGDLFGCDFGVTMSEEEHYDNFADDVEEYEMVELEMVELERLEREMLEPEMVEPACSIANFPTSPMPPQSAFVFSFLTFSMLD